MIYFRCSHAFADLNTFDSSSWFWPRNIKKTNSKVKDKKAWRKKTKLKHMKGNLLRNKFSCAELAATVDANFGRPLSIASFS